ncbi:MAG: phosphatase PAP2 family protein [Acidobacteriaceae bacterium]
MRFVKPLGLSQSSGNAIFYSEFGWRSRSFDTGFQGGRSDLLDISAWLPASVLIAGVTLNYLRFLSPKTIDAELDLGVGRYMMAWGTGHPGYSLFLPLIYAALPLAMAVAIGHSENPRQGAILLVAAGLLAIPLYVAFPARGPRFANDPSAPCNCMPSLHLTRALLLIYVCDRRMRAGFVVFAVLTAVATLTTGEHYILDLIAAVPYTLILIWLTGEPAKLESTILTDVAAPAFDPTRHQSLP